MARPAFRFVPFFYASSGTTGFRLFSNNPNRIAFQVQAATPALWYLSTLVVTVASSQWLGIPANIPYWFYRKDLGDIVAQEWFIPSGGGAVTNLRGVEIIMDPN